MQKRDLMYWYV